MAGLNETTQLASAFNLVRLYPQGWRSGAFRNEENKAVYFAMAEPSGPQKGTVVFTPGYGDSINFHYDAIRNWQDRGYRVYAMDWIGQGLSDRENPNDVHNSNDRLMTKHMNDLHQFVTDVVQKSPGQPLILASHSMGGHIGMMYLKNHPGVFDQAVLAAPLLDLNTSFLPRTAFKGIVTAANAAGLGDNPLPNWRNLLNRVKNASDSMKDLTSRPEQLTLSQEASERIRLLLKPVEVDLPNWLWIKRAYKTMDDMRKPDYFKDIKTPVLLFAAGRDELVDNTTIHMAGKMLPQGRVVDLPTSEHGVWNGNMKNHATLWNSIDEFIDHRAPARIPQASPDQPRLLPAGQTIYPNVAANGPVLAYG